MDEMPKQLGIQTQAGQEIFSDGCSRWSNNIKVLKRRSQLLKTLSALRGRQDFEAEFAGCAAQEATVRKVIDPKSDFSEECYGQLLFRDPLVEPLNHVPYLLTLLRFYKIYLTPAMAVAMPLMAIVLPYILIRFFFNMPMPVGTYVGILRKVYAGGAGGGTGTDLLSQAKYWAQTGWLLFNFVQSMWQPINAAKHLHSLDLTLQEQGSAVRELVLRTWTLHDLFEAAGFKSAPLPIAVSDVTDVRRAIATTLANPKGMLILLRQLGEYELLYRLATSPDICVVHWSVARQPLVRIRGTCDIRVPFEARVPFNVSLPGHAMLTGPNRGGKSTALRAIGRSVFLAHCFGCAVGRNATMTPLRWMQTCLRLQDIPGEQSLFEREVSAAALALRRLGCGRGLILIDELFHSTNPPDAEIASRQFLGKLWMNKKTLSVISTHVFSLVEDCGTEIQRLCCPASEGPRGQVKYKYGLTEGICRVSSVKEILREKFGKASGFGPGLSSTK